MKTLLLLRHAKSSWDDPGLDDHARPLNSRGRNAAQIIGSRLEDESIRIELVLCSTSVRTRETAKKVFANLKTPPSISYLDELYHASPEQIIQILHEIPDPTQVIMVIGHNPGFEEFLSKLTGAPQDFPTAGLAWIELDIDRWKSFDGQTGSRLIKMWRPKDVEAE